jgi:hypothetical protein
LDNTIRKAFIKEQSIGQMMAFSWIRKSGSPEKTFIKLEIDTNPPFGAKSMEKALEFPVPHKIKVNNLPTLFAGKCHALLCREYEKGRDWYDLMWYIDKRIEPNYNYLSSAIQQTGPWEGSDITVDKEWLADRLNQKAKTTDINEINIDIRRFTDNGDKFSILDKERILRSIDRFTRNKIGINHLKSGDYDIGY